MRFMLKELALLYLLVILDQSSGQLQADDCQGMLLKPQKGGELLLVTRTVVVVTFNSTALTSTTVEGLEHLQTLNDTRVLLSFSYNNSSIRMLFNSSSSGVIEIIPNYICTTITLPLDSPRDPENGRVRYSYEEDGNIVAIAKFECDSGYFLNGTKTRVFEISGKILTWNGSDPVCEVEKPTYTPGNRQSGMSSRVSCTCSYCLKSFLLPIMDDPNPLLDPRQLWSLMVLVALLIVILVLVSIGCYVYKLRRSGKRPPDDPIFNLDDTLNENKANPPPSGASNDSPKKQPQQESGVAPSEEQTVSLVQSGPLPAGFRHRPTSTQDKVGKSDLRQPLPASEDTDSSSRVVRSSAVEYETTSSFRPFLITSPSLFSSVVVELDKSSSVGGPCDRFPPGYMNQSSDQGCTALKVTRKNRDLVASYTLEPCVEARCSPVAVEEVSTQKSLQTMDEAQRETGELASIECMQSFAPKNKDRTDQLDQKVDAKSSSYARTPQGNTGPDNDFSGKEKASRRCGESIVLFLILMFFLALCLSLSVYQGVFTTAVPFIPLRGYWIK